MSQLEASRTIGNLQNEDLGVQTKKTIQLDLVSRIREPLILNDKVIGFEELIKVAKEMDHCLPIRGRLSPADLLLLKIGEELEEGNLGIFSRELELNPKIFKKHPQVAKIITEIFGPIETLGRVLALAPDYDPRVLRNDSEYLLAIATELKMRNLDYCEKRHPHLVISGGQGFHVISQLVSYLEKGDLKSAIAIRLHEGDKMRNKGAVTEYIQEIFGQGFRLAKAWQDALA